ncbi:hypothetical protein yc1106_03184 [Curvularia clavata]|uniref:Uncharacterized protein n=1 Tax=Curvularia clavata TaxID=95742 RepID=A0A9Q9DRD1_CURCL|nr:hypothetical protein yc1106_03184 [Curvularia clavata]
MSKKGSDTPSSIRIRENQRRSRNQRKELIQDLQRRVQEYELKGVAATQEMQRAARKVAEENSRLRSLLASRGVTRDEVEAYLRSFDLGTAPSRPALPAQTQPQGAPTVQSVATNHVHWRMPPARQSPMPTPVTPLAPSTLQPPAQPRAEPQRTDEPCSDVVSTDSGSGKHGTATVTSTLQKPAAPAIPDHLSCCRPADGDTHDPSAPSFPMLQDDAECPNTTSCFCPPVSAPKERSFDAGLLISCETAATIIAEMRGNGDRGHIRASLGCVGDGECTVKNTRVLELMDE